MLSVLNSTIKPIISYAVHRSEMIVHCYFLWWINRKCHLILITINIHFFSPSTFSNHSFSFRSFFHSQADCRLVIVDTHKKVYWPSGCETLFLSLCFFFCSDHYPLKSQAFFPFEILKAHHQIEIFNYMFFDLWVKKNLIIFF